MNYKYQKGKPRHKCGSCSFEPVHSVQSWSSLLLRITVVQIIIRLCSMALNGANFTQNWHSPSRRLKYSLPLPLYAICQIYEYDTLHHGFPRLPQAEWGMGQSSIAHRCPGFDFRHSNLCFQISQKGTQWMAIPFGWCPSR